MTLDIQDFNLNTPIKRYKYVRLKLADIPEEIIEEYNLREIVTDDSYVYCEIRKGMYSLPQVLLIAQELLEQQLSKVGYSQSKIIPGLWTHERRQTCFTLVVNNFAIKFRKMEDAQHLIQDLKQNYTITINWGATKYIGLTFDWNYDKGQVHVHMPGYLDKVFLKFKHVAPNKKQNSPHPHAIPQYGAKTQCAESQDESPLLNKEDTKHVQAVMGTLLYYAHAVNSTILTALSSLATEQAKPMQKMMEKVKQLLDYCTSQEEAIITYKKRKMILVVHSGSGCCSEKKLRSQARGHFFFSNKDKFPPNNGAIFTNATIIKAVMASAVKAELGALYLKTKEAVYLQQILIEMGHPQPQTPIQTDNTMAEGVTNKKIQPKCTKAMDVRFHWLRDRESQDQFKIYWRPGKMILADYFTNTTLPITTLMSEQNS